MPYRKEPLVAGQVYHIFNRSVAKQPIFIIQDDYRRAIEVINFYRHHQLPLRFSHFKRLPIEQRKDFFKNLSNISKPMIEILAFCLMPNHFHFLLKPQKEHGVSTFIANFQNSFSKYFNTRYGRTGSLFQSMFKAVRIESDEQLLHVSRYIHLNPVSSFIINIEDLHDYPWSSFKQYVNDRSGNSMVCRELILNYFKSKEDYKNFVFDQADYQRKLESIKHLILE